MAQSLRFPTLRLIALAIGRAHARTTSAIATTSVSAGGSGSLAKLAAPKARLTWVSFVAAAMPAPWTICRCLAPIATLSKSSMEVNAV